jgi:hypothetical protein
MFWLLPGLAAGTSSLYGFGNGAFAGDISDSAAVGTPSDTVDIVYRRVDDFALIWFRFGNAKWRDPTTIETANRASPLTVTVLLSPQHLEEQAIPDSMNWLGTPVWSALSGLSRIGFEISKGTFDFSTEDLLNWSGWKERRVNPLYPLKDIQSGAAAPRPDQTAIELPSRLWLSPDPGAIWVPSTESSNPTTSVVAYRAQHGTIHAQRTELWHLRLISATEALRIRSHDPTQLTGLEKSMVRAVWSDAYPPPCVAGGAVVCPADPPATDLTSLTKDNRSDMVKLSHAQEYAQTASNEGDFDRGVDSRIAVDTLALSATGGWLNLVKHWDTSALANTDTTLVGWINRSELGRDSFVQTETAAYLYPFGFHVVVITTTYRKIVQSVSDATASVALLRQFVTIRFLDRSISNIDPHLVFPTIATDIAETPHLSIPGWDPKAQNIYWPALETSGAIFEFPFSTVDAGGQMQHFTAPQLLVSQEPLQNYTSVLLGKLEAEYYSVPNQPRRRRNFGAQNVVFTSAGPAVAGSNKSSMLPIVEILLAASRDTTPNLNQKIKAPFTPFLDSVRVSLPAGFAVRSGDTTATALVAKQAAPAPSPTSAWFRPVDPGASVPTQPGFLNKNQVFLVRDQAFDTDELTINYNSRAAAIGGVAIPSLDAVGGFGLSGPFGWTPTAQTVLSDPRPPFVPSMLPPFAAGHFNPSDYFGAGAVLLGVNLGQILQEVLNDSTESQLPILQSVQTATGYTYTFKWATAAFAASTQSSSAIFQTDPTNTKLQMAGQVQVDFTGQQTSFSANGQITDVTINLSFGSVGGLSLYFESVSFVEQSGSSTKFSVSLRPPGITFSGSLNFISGMLNALDSTFGGLVGSAADALTVTGSGLTYRLPTVSIPDIALGIIDIRNITFTSSVNLPFTSVSQTQVTFGLSSMDRPFLISAFGLGGGGYTSITADTTHIDVFDVALQFGGDVSINLGVVAGDAYILVGVMYGCDHTDPNNPVVTFSAYLHGGVDVEVLDLISASASVDIALNYVDQNGQATLTGSADLTFEVDVIGFSKSVSVTYTYTIVGGSAAQIEALAEGRSVDEAAALFWQKYQAAFGE